MEPKYVQEYLDQSLATCWESAMYMAVYDGRLDIVQWLYSNQSDGELYYMMLLAANLDHLDILQFLYNHNKTIECIQEMSATTYEKLLPFILLDFKKMFDHIQKQVIVREFIRKKIVYHPNSCYMKRIVNDFD
jgi:hypothetical protein